MSQDKCSFLKSPISLRSVTPEKGQKKMDFLMLSSSLVWQKKVFKENFSDKEFFASLVKCILHLCPIFVQIFSKFILHVRQMKGSQNRFYRGSGMHLSSFPSLK